MEVTESDPSNGNNVGNEALAIAAGDVNNDGAIDLLATTAAIRISENPFNAIKNNAAIEIFAGDGEGNFAAPSRTYVGSQPESIQVADLNGDFDQDLVYIRRQSPANSQVEVLLGDGTGNYSRQNRQDISSYFERTGAFSGTLVDGAYF